MTTSQTQTQPSTYTAWKQDILVAEAGNMTDLLAAVRAAHAYECDGSSGWSVDISHGDDVYKTQPMYVKCEVADQ